MPRRVWLILIFIAVTVSQAAAADLQDALRLQRAGKNQEALAALRGLLPNLRSSGDRAALASALTAMADASLALGDYESAIRSAREAHDLHQQTGQRAEAPWDLNTVALAEMYLGRYDAALADYQSALALDRERGDSDGEITRLNNIGNVHFLRGRYADALILYQDALANADSRATERARPRLRKMTLSNQAALFQRIGANERALALYDRLRSAGTMEPSEEAQLLINEGALLRRLGDPVKALDKYRQAQRLFSTAHHRDGEIGAWRNIGIVYALDLHDERLAFDAFDAALNLARESSNRRGEVQARLYRGEMLRRNGRSADASADLQAALEGATSAGLVEERWKALYSLGRVSEAGGNRDEARRSFEQAAAIFESVRTDLRTPGLRSEFLADKRDVYDALIALRLSEPDPSAADVFQLIERSRARTWQDRLQTGVRSPSLVDVQHTIDPGTLLVEYWTTPTQLAVIWLSSSTAGVVARPIDSSASGPIEQFVSAMQSSGAEWRVASRAAGETLLTGWPDLRMVTRVQVVPDGPLHFIPFEALTVPGSHDVLIERVEVSYLPSASMLFRSRSENRSWMWPWQRQVVAIGDPDVARTDPVNPREARSSLPYAEEEMRSIEAMLPGRADLHTGRAATKDVLSRGLGRVPVLHISTHAVSDTRDPDRSRVLLASGAGTADDLFLREVYDLDLHGVQLVTMSACSTERGPVIRGEGVEGFSRALLAAGAAATVTTLWDVADRASAEFMKQFYFGLSQRDTEGAALRAAKLQFLRSHLAWSHPRYWAGYVLTGTGGGRLPYVIRWAAVWGVVLVVLIAGLAASRVRRASHSTT